MKKSKLVLILLFLFSCSGVNKNRLYVKKINKEIHNNNYNSALKIAEEKDFYSEKKNKLLKNLELGTIHYLKNNYYQSLKYFEMAKKISDELYTISISKKVASGFDANLDNYYGEKYERSMIRFYLSLINYNIYQQGFYEEYIDENKNLIEKKELTNEEKKFHLTYARSSIVEWDSFLQTLQNENQGISIYKNDMLAKIWGAFIHNEYGGSMDKQIAIQLYKDAKELLLRNYNMFPIFNNKSKEFNNDFKKLPNISLSDLYKNYIDETKYSIKLNEFIDRNKKNLEKKQYDNLIITLKDSLISPKIAIPIKIPIDLSAYYGKIDTSLFSNYLTIEFPIIQENKNINEYEAKIFKNNIEIASTKLTLIQPLSDIAKKTLDDEKTKIMSASIARITAKYIALLISSSALYDKDNEVSWFIAKAYYLAGLKVINETSKADLRYWSTLFSDLQMGGIKLNNGNYTLKIYSNNKEIYNKEVKIENNKTTFIDINKM